MKEFQVAMPFTGVAYRTIEAETEEEAIVKFLDETTLPFTHPTKNDAQVEEWSFTEKIVGGNVFYGVQNEVDVQES